MPTGHIKLGLYNDIRPYLVDDVKGVSRDGANPFSAPGGGTQGYNDLEGWAEFTMKDWQAGAGRTDPEEGGFLFGTMDSRVPNQLTLPTMAYPVPAAGEVTTINVFWRDKRINGFVTVGPAAAIRKYGNRFQNFLLGTGHVSQQVIGSLVYAYVKGAIGTVVTFEVYRATATVVGALLGTGTITLDNTTAAPRWEEITLVAGTGGLWTAAAPNDYIVCAVSASAAIELGTLTAPGGQPFDCKYGAASYNGTTWTLGAINGANIGAVMNGAQIPARLFSHPFDSICEYYGSVYAASSADDAVWNWTANSASMTLTGDASLRVPASWATNGKVSNLYGGLDKLIVFCDTYVDATKTALSYNGTGAVWASYPDIVGGYKLHAHDEGYLWISNGVDIRYFSDGIWTTVAGVADATSPIQAIACMNGDLYFATRKGLGRIAKGDYPVGVVTWHAYEGNDSIRMDAFQGTIFVSTNNMLYRIDQSHTVMQVRIPGNDLQLQSYGRDITALCAGSSWMFIATSGTTGGMIWAWTPQGMHPVGPLVATVKSMCYSRSLQSLFMGGIGRVWQMHVPDATIDPYFDNGSVYESDGWLETDRFFGANVLLRKDYESVYIEREGRDAYGDVYVYWQDDSHSAWQLLDILAGVSGELRWEDYATRPNSRWLRLGVRLRVSTSNVYTENRSPRIRAISLKYIPMVNDRYRWRVNILVPPRQMDANMEMLTGTYSQASMLAHLDSCIKSVAPVIFEDFDEVKYETKVTAHSRNVERYEAVRGGDPIVTWLYSLTLEQVNSDPY